MRLNILHLSSQNLPALLDILDPNDSEFSKLTAAIHQHSGKSRTPENIAEIKLSGDHSGEVTPVPIPNTEVKLPCADGTAADRRWESRTSPDSFIKKIQ